MDLLYFLFEGVIYYGIAWVVLLSEHWALSSDGLRCSSPTTIIRDQTNVLLLCKVSKIVRVAKT